MAEDLFKGTFLGELAGVIEKNEFQGPGDEVKPEEKSEGEMNQLEKAVWTLSNKKDRLAGMLELKIRFDVSNPSEKEVLLNEMILLKQQAKFLRELMWLIIKERLNLEGKSIGIRGNFTIVSFESDEHPLARLLKFV